MKHLFLVLNLVLLAACGSKNNKPNQLIESKNSSAIIGGTKVKDGAEVGSSIVGIYDTIGQFTCTGSLLTDNVVLTAAHCIENGGKGIKIVFGVQLIATVMAREVDIQNNFVRRATSAIVHPGYNEKENEIKNTDWNDLALIKFAGSVPEGFKPATFLTDSSILKKGQMVKLAGYGVTNVDVQPINAKKYKNIDAAIDSGEVVCDDDKKTHCYKMDFQGDDELYETMAPIESLSVSEIHLDESLGHGTCEGDSGGPAYIEKDGVNYLFGITSRGTFSCDSSGVYTNALVFKQWIEENSKKLK